MDDKKAKKSRKEKDKESREKKVSRVNYDAVVDRQVGDKRFERERAHKIKTQEQGVAALKEPQAAVSSTFDAFQRMAAGLDGRTIQDKLADPNRPTWEQYKKDNEDKLDLVGDEMKKMVQYRAKLDLERDRRLQGGQVKKEVAISDSDEEQDRGSSKKHSKKDSKKSKKHSKKSKKHSKKSKKRHRKDDSDQEGDEDSSASSSDSESDGDDNDQKKSKKSKSKKRSRKDGEGDADKGDGDEAPMRLSAFMKAAYDSD